MRLIDADRLKEELYTADGLWSHGSHPRVVEEGDIDAMPTVDSAKHGHWILIQTAEGDEEYHCNNCGYGRWSTTPYCPMCGSKMNEMQNER